MITARTETTLQEHERRDGGSAHPALGWASVGLGLATLLAPQPIARSLGLDNHRGMVRLLGAAICAVGAAESVRASRNGGALQAVRGEVYVEHSVSVNKTPAECYAFWRNLENIARFASMIESVTALDESRARWILRRPAGAEWTTEFTATRPGERLSWHTLEGGQVNHAGVVQFAPAPGGRGTVMRVSMHYRAPGGSATSWLVKLLGRDPQSELREDLRRLKQLIEAGEIATTVGQPSGRRSLLGRMTREGRRSRQGEYR